MHYHADGGAALITYKRIESFQFGTKVGYFIGYSKTKAGFVLR